MNENGLGNQHIVHNNVLYLVQTKREWHACQGVLESKLVP